MPVAQLLIEWYQINKRPLPWRETRDPYKIWLSEVILQQTRVAQGLEYYERFLTAFPDIQSLATADEQDVLKIWQGLGYYSRARNMHHAAKEIVEKHSGVFPGSADGLKNLKGIGEYTAAAIASICYDEPIAVLDGNVARVISRLYAFDKPVDTHNGRKHITELANQLLSTHHPGTFNQAIMELGALVCAPKSPACHTCPLAFTCEAFKTKETEKFPVKTPKKTPVVRHMNYLVISYLKNGEEFIFMRKRTGNDIWKNMYDFPCIETDNASEVPLILEQYRETGFSFTLPYVVQHVSPEYIHQLSHRRLLARFIRIRLPGLPQISPDNITSVRKEQIGDLPLPMLIDRYLADWLNPTDL
jgi:A/G-specific adenine glycosylase